MAEVIDTQFHEIMISYILLSINLDQWARFLPILQGRPLHPETPVLSRRLRAGCVSRRKTAATDERSLRFWRACDRRALLARPGAGGVIPYSRPSPTRVITASVKSTRRTKQPPPDPDGIGDQRRAFLDEKVLP
jgi:hypothetical protein